MCFVDLGKAFCRAMKKFVAWAMRDKCIPEALVAAVMSQYKGAKTKVKVGIHFSVE